MSGLSPERREELLEAWSWGPGIERIASLVAGWLAAEREAGAAEVRAQVWNVLNDVIADHPMWIGGDGQPLDYSPEREARVHDFIREVSAALNGGE